jgi:hypothetical protein
LTSPFLIGFLYVHSLMQFFWRLFFFSDMKIVTKLVTRYRLWVKTKRLFLVCQCINWKGLLRKLLANSCNFQMGTYILVWRHWHVWCTCSEFLSFSLNCM